MNSALEAAGRFARRALADDALRRLPAAIGGRDAWLPHAVLSAVDHLSEAIASRDPHRPAHWLRTVMRVPSEAEVVAICDAVCDAHVARTRASRSGADAVRRLVREQLAGVRAELEAVPAAPAPRAVAEALVQTLRIGAPAVAEHVEATAVLARRIGVRMGVDAATIGRTELAALLHDVGHLGTPRLAFAPELDAGDRANIAAHAGDAERVVAAIPALAAVAPIVRAHHERFDGSGGPDGAMRDGIPLEARIIAVADAFHVMTTLSPGRSSTIVRDALEAIDRGAGSVFDPAPVAAMQALFRPIRRRAASA